VLAALAIPVSVGSYGEGRQTMRNTSPSAASCSELELGRRHDRKPTTPTSRRRKETVARAMKVMDPALMMASPELWPCESGTKRSGILKID